MKKTIIISCVFLLTCCILQAQEVETILEENKTTIHSIELTQGTINYDKEQFNENSQHTQSQEIIINNQINQQTDTNQPLTIKGVSIYQHGRKLKREEVKSLFLNASANYSYDLYLKGLSNRTTGNILLWTGVGCLTLIPIFAIGEENNYDESNGYIIGVGVAAYAAILLPCIGIGLKVYGKKQIRRSIDKYNASLLYRSDIKSELYFGSTKHGIGFTLNF